MVTLATLYLRDPVILTTVVTTGIDSSSPYGAYVLNDADDATLFRVGMTGDGVVEGVGTASVYARLTTFITDPDVAIAQVTIRIRAEENSIGVATLRPTVDGAGVSSAIVPSTPPAWHEFVLTTDPATGLAWTAAGVMGRPFGWYCTLDSNSVDFEAVVDVFEYEVLVQGAAAQITTYGSVPQNAQAQASSGASPVTVLDGYRVSTDPLPGYVAIPQPNTGGVVLKPYPTNGYAAAKVASDANATLSTKSVRSMGGASSVGSINQAAVESDPAQWIFGDTPKFHVLASINSLPIQHSSPDEIHAFLTVFDALTAIDVVRFGVTPNGRLAVAVNGAILGVSGQAFTVQSSIGAVQPDGVPRTFKVDFVDDLQGGVSLGATDYGIGLYVDGALLVHLKIGALFQLTPTASDQDRRLMLFNSPDGMTRMDHAISFVRLMVDAEEYLYRLDEGEGVTLFPTYYDYADPNGNVAVTRPQKELTLRALADGEFGQSLAWGPATSGELRWNMLPGFTKRSPAAPTYRNVSGGSQA